MSHYTVKPGDCLSSIAGRFGFSDYKLIYEHPENATLRAKRKDPNVLHPGDQVFIPDPRQKSVECATGRSHRFVLKRPKRELRVVLMDPHGKPMADLPYRLVAGDVTIDGQTGDDGRVQAVVSAGVDEATLTIQGFTRTLHIGHLNPLRDTPDGGLSGIKARLTNLGFDTRGFGGSMDEDTRDAIKAFQEANGLEPTGDIDDSLLAKLDEKHLC